MSNYTPITNFTAKDALSHGDPNKIILGATLSAEFAALQTAVNTKYDSGSGVALLASANVFTASQTVSKASTASFTLTATDTSNAHLILNTSSTNRGFVGAVGAAASLVTGSLAGDLAIRAESGNIDISCNAGTTMHAQFTAGGLILNTALALLYGGTGSTTASGARTNLGVTATGADTTYAFRSNNLSDVTASTARTNLGGTTVGQAFYVLTNPSAITFPRINADNSVTAQTATNYRTDLGLGTAAVQNVGVFAQVANNLSDVTAATARTNLGTNDAANITAGTLAIARGGTAQTTQLGITREVTKAWTIASDPGGTPSGTYGDVFAYY